MHLRLKTLLVMVPVILSACGKKETSREDVQSDLLTSISLASEAETFVGYIAQRRSTYFFASGHLQNLRNEANRSAQDLSNLNASANLIPVLTINRDQLSRLVVQLENVQRHLGQPSALGRYQHQIHEIRMTLIQADSSL